MGLGDREWGLAEGTTVTVALALGVGLWVGVPVWEMEGVGMQELEAVRVGLAVSDKDTLGDRDAETEGVQEAVGDETVRVRHVRDTLRLTVLVPGADFEGVDDGWERLGVREAEGEGALGVRVRKAEMVTVAVGLARGDRVRVGLWRTEAEGVAEAVAVDGETDGDSVTLGDAVPVRDAMAVQDGDPLVVRDGVGVSVPVRGPEGEGVGDADRVRDGDALVDPDCAGVADALGLPEGTRVGVGVAVRDREAMRVGGVTERVGEERDGEGLQVTLRVRDAVGGWVAVWLGDAVVLGCGVGVGLADPERLAEAVSETVAVDAEGDALGLRLEDSVGGVGVGERLGTLQDSVREERVPDGEAVAVAVAVGRAERVAVGERDGVEQVAVGVREGEGETLRGLAEGDADGDRLGEAVADRVHDGLLEAEPVSVRVAVGERLADGVRERLWGRVVVREGLPVAARDRVRVALPEPVGAGVGDRVGVRLPDQDALRVSVSLREADAVALGEAVRVDREAVGVRLPRLVVLERLALPDAEAAAVVVGLRVPDAVKEGVALAVSDAEAVAVEYVRERDGVGDRVPVGVPEAVADREAEREAVLRLLVPDPRDAVAVRVGEEDAVGDADGLLDGLGVAVGDALGDSDRLQDTDGEAVAVAVRRGELEAERVRVTDGEAVAVLLVEGLREGLGLQLRDRLSDADTVQEAVPLLLRAGDALAVREVGVALRPEAVAVAVSVKLAEGGRLPVLEGVREGDTEGVAVRRPERVPDRLPVGVMVGECDDADMVAPDAVAVGLGLGLRLGLSLGVRLGDIEGEAVVLPLEGLTVAVGVRDGPEGERERVVFRVVDRVMVRVRLRLGERGDCVGLELRVGVGDAVPLADRDAVQAREALQDGDTERESEGLDGDCVREAVPVGEAVGVGERLGERDAVGDVLPDAVGLWLGLPGYVPLGEREAVRVGVGVRDVRDGDGVRVRVPLTAPVPEPVKEGLRDAEDVAVKVAVGCAESDPVAVAVLLPRGVGEGLSVTVSRRERDAEVLPEPVPVPVAVCVGPRDPVRVAVGVRVSGGVAEQEGVGLDGLGVERVAVWEALRGRERDVDALQEMLAVPVGVRDRETEGCGDWVPVGERGEAVAEAEWEPVAEAVAERGREALAEAVMEGERGERDAVDGEAEGGLPDGTALRVAVPEALRGVGVAVGVGVPVGLGAEGVSVRVRDRLRVGLVVRVSVAVEREQETTDPEGVAVAVREGERVVAVPVGVAGDAVRVTRWDSVPVGVGDAKGEGVGDGVAEAVGADGVGLRESVHDDRVALAVRPLRLCVGGDSVELVVGDVEGERECDAVMCDGEAVPEVQEAVEDKEAGSDWLPVAVPPRERVPVPVSEPDREAEAVSVSVSVALAVGVAVALPVGLPEAEREEADPVRVELAVVEPEHEADTVRDPEGGGVAVAEGL